MGRQPKTAGDAEEIESVGLVAAAALAYARRMKNRALLVALTALHIGVSSVALYKHGYLELYAFAFRDLPQVQIFMDLSVGVTIANIFLIRDAKQTGRNPWPFVVGTVLLGSLSPLLYFLIGAFSPAKPAAA